MAYNRIVISSGHGKYVRGASGILDEVNEARRVVDQVADLMSHRGVDVVVFHDNSSTTQSENLNTIVAAHNAEARDLDVSIHFNAYVETDKPMGVEVLYVTQSGLAGEISSAIASCGFVNRGPKKRTDLFFLNNTEMPAILIEVCFVDSEADAAIYNARFEAICEAIVDELGGAEIVEPPDTSLTGKVSQFGGPEDEGVSDDEGLAFISDVMDAPHLFLPEDTPGTEGMGLARRLNPFIHYIACRWNYDKISKSELLETVVSVRALKTGMMLTAFPADWGPHESTGRIADISPGLMADLGITTDDEVEVTFPA